MASLTAPSIPALHHSSSEPNIAKSNKSVRVQCEISDVKRRSKRKCSESRTDQESCLSTFMSEIKKLFCEFKDEQNRKIEKLSDSMQEIKLQNSNIQSIISFLSQEYDSLKNTSTSNLTKKRFMETYRKYNKEYGKLTTERLKISG